MELNLPVFIKQDNALDLISQIEGDFWKNNQIYDQGKPTGFFWHKRMWRKLQEDMIDYDPEEKEFFKNTYRGGPIYGEGGVHRYFIRFSGEIIFGEGFVMNRDRLDLARFLGFTIVP